MAILPKAAKTTVSKIILKKVDKTTEEYAFKKTIKAMDPNDASVQYLKSAPEYKNFIKSKNSTRSESFDDLKSSQVFKNLVETPNFLEVKKHHNPSTTYKFFKKGNNIILKGNKTDSILNMLLFLKETYDFTEIQYRSEHDKAVPINMKTIEQLVTIKYGELFCETTNCNTKKKHEFMIVLVNYKERISKDKNKRVSLIKKTRSALNFSDINMIPQKVAIKATNDKSTNHKPLEINIEFFP
ncbi:hypothetical protein BX661DRAFT_181389 [Kickxella alabastrina]|uniref:uncharacterized protein n=1 Tax=Kickxella alabastrina TaxID=61397 RepID=UPI00221EA389|nr:uncharacterized protein BX661DRAFT_181389 [Kickxella alabastrina]KAI7829112.1 hypothetical protein BX661DRAFT_181389 [Kickxella alabastrina]